MFSSVQWCLLEPLMILTSAMTQFAFWFYDNFLFAMPDQHDTSALTMLANLTQLEAINLQASGESMPTLPSLNFSFFISVIPKCFLGRLPPILTANTIRIWATCRFEASCLDSPLIQQSFRHNTIFNIFHLSTSTCSIVVSYSTSTRHLLRSWHVNTLIHSFPLSFK